MSTFLHASLDTSHWETLNREVRDICEAVWLEVPLREKPLKWLA